MNGIVLDIRIAKKNTVLKVRGSISYFSIDFLKISINFETEGVKILNEILDFSTEIKFRG